MASHSSFNQQHKILFAFTLPLFNLLTAPLEFIRAKMQFNILKPDENFLARQYKNPLDCFRKSTEKGYKPLWSNYKDSLVKSCITEIMTFMIKGKFQNIFNNIFKKYQLGNTFLSNFLGGAFSGLFVRTFIYPLENLKNINSVQLLSKQMNFQINDTIIQKLLKIHKVKGIQGLYQGLIYSLIGVMLFRSIYFSIFDTFKLKTSDLSQKWFLSYFSAISALSLSYPFDTIRRRLNETNKDKSSKYNGYMDCIRQIRKKQGLRIFYQGYSLIFLQSGAAACIYLTMEMMVKQVEE